MDNIELTMFPIDRLYEFLTAR